MRCNTRDSSVSNRTTERQHLANGYKMSVAGVFRTLAIVYLVFPSNVLALWWVGGRRARLDLDEKGICRKSRHFGTKQHEMCLHEPEIVREVAQSVTMATDECKYQFRDQLWNCSTTPRHVMKLLKTDSRETAFLHAIIGAGALHAVAEGCSRGRLLGCSCDNSVYSSRPPRSNTRSSKPSPPSALHGSSGGGAGGGKTVGGETTAAGGDWSWGGCTDDVMFAYTKTKQFVDVEQNEKKGNDFRVMLQTHNYEAGRLASRRYMRMSCKCHGLSGSCSMKTCWRRVPPFSDVGERLKARYDASVKVTVSNDDGRNLQPAAGRNPKPYTDEDLVYSQPSPDYCVRSKKLGTAGTRGRTCDPASRGSGGCDILCCNRGYRSQTLTVVENCQCKFKWCCEVICQTCHVQQTVHTCK